MSQLPPTCSGQPSSEPSPEPSSEPHLPTCPDTNDGELPEIGPRARHGRQHPIPETRAFHGSPDTGDRHRVDTADSGLSSISCSAVDTIARTLSTPGGHGRDA